MIQRTVGVLLLIIAACLAGHAFGVQMPSEWTVEAVMNQHLSKPWENGVERGGTFVFACIFFGLSLVQLLHPNPKG